MAHSSSPRPTSAKKKTGKKKKSTSVRYECFTCGTKQHLHKHSTTMFCSTGFTFLRDLATERPDKPCGKCNVGRCGPRGGSPSKNTQETKRDMKIHRESTRMGDRGAHMASSGSYTGGSSGNCPRGTFSPVELCSIID